MTIKKGSYFFCTSCILFFGPIIVLPCKSLTKSVSNAFAPNQVEVYPIFIKVVTIVCQSWYMDLSKFLNAFFTVITCIPCRLTVSLTVKYPFFMPSLQGTRQKLLFAKGVAEDLCH